jgi:hypothetical protein
MILDDASEANSSVQFGTDTPASGRASRREKKNAERNLGGIRQVDSSIVCNVEQEVTRRSEMILRRLHGETYNG